MNPTGTIDGGHGADHVGITAGLGIMDHGNHLTNWEIKKFDEVVYEKSAKALFVRASNHLILANFYRSKKDHVTAAYHKGEAELIQKEAEAMAFGGSLFQGNLLLNEGINEMWDLITAAGGTTAYNNAAARLGVGDSTTAAAATDTGLIAATNKLYKAMESGFPTSGTAQKATWKSSYASSEANYAWNEFCLDNGSTPTKDMNRKVSVQGTKTSGQTWTLTLDITLS